VDPVYNPDRLPSRFTVDFSVLLSDQVWIIEDEPGGFKVNAVFCYIPSIFGFIPGYVPITFCIDESVYTLSGEIKRRFVMIVMYPLMAAIILLRFATPPLGCA
jgi:hypothetical protein